ncbi:MAG: hypothetical protein CMA77_04175 [Euryarchaeota archaeon]|nr:hypothetical protein [Euryarchaeota archaeon]|tara:strand:+ start:997 stop:1203 length:207 start_codon:yes stop_codon:yes gene_type:complete
MVTVLKDSPDLPIFLVIVIISIIGVKIDKNGLQRHVLIDLMMVGVHIWWVGRRGAHVVRYQTPRAIHK